jgi:hypothetical protein
MSRWLMVLIAGCTPDPKVADDTGAEPAPTELRELAYDDGRGDSVSIGPGAGGQVAVRFSVPEPATLDSVRFLLTDEGTPDAAFGVQVLGPDEAGAPGAVLWPTDGGSHTTARSSPDGYAWVTVDVGGIDVPEEFFVAMTWTTAPGVGLDEAQRLAFDLSEPDGRTWVDSGSGWTEWPGPVAAPAGDVAIRTTVAVPVGALPEDPVVLRNVDDGCGGFDAVYAEPDGAGVAVARLAPERAFSLDFVRVQGAHTVPFGGHCDATLPFAVDLYVGEGLVPAAEPTLIERFEPALDTVDDIPVVQLDLTPSQPLELAAGEALFVAVHLAGDGGASPCVDACLGPLVPEVDAWAYGAEAPYDWETFTALGVPANLNIAAFGADAD